MEKEQQIYEQQGMEDYIKYQVEHEAEPFSPGPAFSFVKVRAYEGKEVEKHIHRHSAAHTQKHTHTTVYQIHCGVIPW